MANPHKPGLDTFWEEADQAGSPQDPIERELDERTDALARYRRLITEAETNGRDEAAEILMKQYVREEEEVARLREAIRRRQEAGGGG